MSKTKTTKKVKAGTDEKSSTPVMWMQTYPPATLEDVENALGLVSSGRSVSESWLAKARALGEGLPQSDYQPYIGYLLACSIGTYRAAVPEGDLDAEIEWIEAQLASRRSR